LALEGFLAKTPFDSTIWLSTTLIC